MKRVVSAPSPQTFTSYSDALAAQVRDLELALEILTAKYWQILSGGYTRCIAPDCDNLLFGRLAAGYVTCSPVCQHRLQMLTGSFKPEGGPKRLEGPRPIPPRARP